MTGGVPAGGVSVGGGPAGRLDPPPAMAGGEARLVLGAIAAAGGAARFVGGCVRDALLGRDLRDVDVATDLEPERVVAALRDAGIRAVPTGLDHGTVTAVVGRRPFEVTTLRRDVETDGRRAVVAFTRDWREDAGRRDFTMNALSLDPGGDLYDYFGGVADAQAGRVRFVGEPERRIREDVLRLLRFFRFHAHYGRGAPDAAGLDACARLAPLLPTLSAERVRAELLRLLEAPDPAATWRLMEGAGVVARILPEARRVGRLDGVVRIGPPDPVLRLAAVLDGGRDAALGVAERLRLSNVERDRLALLAEPPLAVAPEGDARALRRALHRLGADRVRDLLFLSAAEREEGRAALERALAEAAAWRPLDPPVRGRDLIERGLPPGPEMGRLIAEMEAWWEERDYRPDRAACLAELDRRLAARGG